MNKVIIGIDPDSKAHGVAIYEDGKLVSLRSLNLLCLYALFRSGYLEKQDRALIEIHIEDVNGVSAAFGARDKKTKLNIKLKMAQYIGMCKQSQVEVERLAHYLGIKVVKYKISKTWKKDKAQFKSVTGWGSQSNEDTRSAAYFGWLGTQSK